MTWTPPLPPLAIVAVSKPISNGRDEKGRWAKGQSGNPSGRPPSVGEVRRLARELVPEAMERLVKIIRDDNAPYAAHIAAAQTLLDRGYGKAVQPVAVGGPGDFDELTDEELHAFILQESILIVRGHDEGSS